MAKKVTPNVADAGLNYVKTNVERIVITSAEPGNYGAVAGVTLADAAFTSTEVTGPEADAAGRRIVLTAVEDIEVDVTGEANHVCLVRDTESEEELLLVTTISNAQTVTQGNFIDTSAFNHVIADVE